MSVRHNRSIVVVSLLLLSLVACRQDPEVEKQRALERAGFEREGVARGAQWRGGRWHDLVLYARLRGDA